MALAAHEMNVAAGDTHVIGHERAVVVDPEQGIGGHVEKAVVVDKERGVAAHVEKTTVAVDLGGGQVGVLHQQRVMEVQAAPDQQQQEKLPMYHTPQQQPGYPPQAGYPPQPGYPPQAGYPPQPGYPPQAGYPPQPGYPPQGGYGDVPPPYGAPAYGQYPPAAQQQSSVNMVVVQQQPQVQHVVQRRNGTADYATGALVFAIVVTVIIFVFQCYWGLICSLTAIALASNANSAGAAGNYETAKSQNSYSICCSVSAVISVFVIPAVIIGILVGTGG